MNDEINPYQATPETSSDDSSTARHSFLWPHTKTRCILLALFAWPITMFATDIIGIVAEPITGLDDFGLAVSNITMPLFLLYGVCLWFRGFILHERSPSAIAAAIFTLPAWFSFTAIVTFMNFPLGRIDPNF